MLDRRQSVRDKVFLGAVAEINQGASTMDCVVRNISEGGACVEIDENARLPEDISLTIPCKHRSFLAHMIWRHANRVGLAFQTMFKDVPGNDLEARLRRSEIKQRLLKRRIKELLGEG